MGVRIEAWFSVDIGSTATFDAIPFALHFCGKKGFAAQWPAVLSGVMSLPVTEIAVISSIAIEAGPKLGQTA